VNALSTERRMGDGAEVPAVSGKRSIAATTSTAALADSEYLTPQEAARILKLSARTITRRFRDLPGVFTLQGESYERIRIPRGVFDAFVNTHSAGFSMKSGKRGA
jgi:hypothetical protein